ncbi:Activator 1 140 kDa subunit, putative [Hondaea fermentalgiana]|uniref:Activator 1 140 kDa subunit, putative n=1 Tax=Hondaea fermentalgiana TaxID=2315210 RepID=A0A2R5G6E8_9STRA|nr:Activator 1 140 kDa subunit, putative [Hondaea fermentalgiana]|eukprot:GBG26616.1 Activator 1 140 kDa subunit, putative [Hondaea fermentalgiana]
MDSDGRTSASPARSAWSVGLASVLERAAERQERGQQRRGEEDGHDAADHLFGNVLDANVLGLELVAATERENSDNEEEDEEDREPRSAFGGPGLTVSSLFGGDDSAAGDKEQNMWDAALDSVLEDSLDAEKALEQERAHADALQGQLESSAHAMEELRDVIRARDQTLETVRKDLLAEKLRRREAERKLADLEADNTNLRVDLDEAHARLDALLRVQSPRHSMSNAVQPLLDVQPSSSPGHGQTGQRNTLIGDREETKSENSAGPSLWPHHAWALELAAERDFQRRLLLGKDPADRRLQSAWEEASIPFRERLAVIQQLDDLAAEERPLYAAEQLERVKRRARSTPDASKVLRVARQLEAVVSRILCHLARIMRSRRTSSRRAPKVLDWSAEDDIEDDDEEDDDDDESSHGGFKSTTTRFRSARKTSESDSDEDDEDSDSADEQKLSGKRRKATSPFTMKRFRRCFNSNKDKIHSKAFCVLISLLDEDEDEDDAEDVKDEQTQATFYRALQASVRAGQPMIIISTSDGDAANPTTLRRVFSDQIMGSALSLNLGRIAPGRLTRVLRSIADAEGVSVPNNAILDMALRANGDLRCAIQMLQFYCIGRPDAQVDHAKGKRRRRGPAPSVAVRALERKLKRTEGRGVSVGKTKRRAHNEDNDDNEEEEEEDANARDTVYSINHAVGKLLRAKTLGEEYDEEKGKAAGRNLGPLCPTERARLAFDPEQVAQACELDADALCAFVQYNAPQHYVEIGELAEALDYLSLADVFIGGGLRNDTGVWAMESAGRAFPGAYSSDMHVSAKELSDDEIEIEP